MEFNELFQRLLHDTLGSTDVSGTTAGSVIVFLPELVLCGTVLLMLLARIFRWTQWIDAFYLALAGSVIALWYSVPVGGMTQVAQQNSVVTSQEIFTGLLIYDSLAAYFHCLLLFFSVLFVLLTKLTRLVDHEDSADFYSLVLGATLGMCIMVSANHLLMVFLGVEIASVPSYVLVGWLKGQHRSSEAALKYSVYGAGAAGVMLYGISLLMGVLNSGHLPVMASQLATRLTANLGSTNMLMPEHVAVLAVAGLMVMVGLAFKLSAVPFHFWCPDAFEGASSEVAAFLSVASKIAALALLVRVSLAFGYVPNPPTTGLLSVADHVGTAERQTGSDILSASESRQALRPVRAYMVQLVALIAVITCTFGNLAAYGQTNIKRLLAYSTIAHAGYMMMPVAAALTAIGSDLSLAKVAVTSLVFYASLYLFMNLGAFAVVAFLRDAIGSEEISDYAGLVRHCPATVVAFSLILISLVGLPPLAGFAGKFAIFAALVDCGGPLMIALLIIAGLNTAISLVYYLRVVKVMTIDPAPESRSGVRLRWFSVSYVMAVTLPVLVFGVWFQGIYSWAEAAATHMLP